MQLSQIEMVALAYYAGFRGSQIDDIVAIAHQESGYETTRRHVNSDQYRSVDRGLFQINNHYHPDVSDTCAYNPVCAAKAAYQISKQGTNFGAWDSNVDGWRSVVPSTKATRENTNWSALVGQWATTVPGSPPGGGRGPRGQPDDTNPSGGTGTADNGQSSVIGTADPYYGSLLFHCSSGGVTEGHILQVVPIPTLSLPDIGCYLRDTLEFVGLAVGGLLGIGVGMLLLANSNQTIKGATETVKKTAMQGAAIAAIPETGGASEAGELTAGQLATQQRHADRQAFNLQREQRIASAQPNRDKKAKAEARKTTEQAKALQEQRLTSRQERLERKRYGNTRKPDSVLGVKIDWDAMGVPGATDDPSRMKY